MEFLERHRQHSSARSTLRGLPLLLLLLLLLLLGPPTATAAEPAVPREYQVKAAFLYNFAQFTDWPPQTFASENSPLVIGILGEDPFGPALEATVRDESVRNHPLKVVRFRTVAEMPTCHIIYVARSEASRLPQILRVLKGQSILTVTDIDGAAERGVMIQFVIEHSRVRFKINPPAATDAHLNLSSKLLRVADIVETQKK